LLRNYPFPVHPTDPRFDQLSRFESQSKSSDRTTRTRPLSLAFFNRLCLQSRLRISNLLLDRAPELRAQTISLLPRDGSAGQKGAGNAIECAVAGLTLAFDRPDRKRPGKNSCSLSEVRESRFLARRFIGSRQERAEREREGGEGALALYKRGALVKSRVLIF